MQIRDDALTRLITQYTKIKMFSFLVYARLDTRKGVSSCCQISKNFVRKNDFPIM